MRRWRHWTSRGSATRFFSEVALGKSGVSPGNTPAELLQNPCPEESADQSLDVFKILGLFRDKGEEQALNSSTVAGILRQGNWQAKLSEEFSRHRESLNYRLVEGVIRDCKDASCAMEFFQWAGKQDSLVRTLEGHNLVLEKLVQEGLLSQAEYLFDHMEYAGFPPDLTSHCILIRGMFLMGEYEKACLRLDVMLGKGMVPMAYLVNTILETLSRVGNFDQAIGYWNALPEAFMADVTTYRIMVEVYCKAGQHREALQLMEKMPDFDGHVPSFSCYTIVMGSLAKSGKGAEALEMFRKMEEQGSQMDIELFGDLITALCRSKMVDDAKLIFSEMESKHSFKPDVICHNSLMSGLCKAGRFVEAMDLLEKMDVVPSFITYTTLIDHLMAAKRLRDAYKVFQHMDHSSTIGCTVGAYTNLFDGLQRANMLDEAYGVYRHLEKQGISLDEKAYNTIMHGLCKMEYGGPEALKLFHEMLGKNYIPNFIGFSVLVCKLCRDGAALEAFRLFQTMASKDYFEADVVLYNTLIRGLCSARSIDIARSLFNEMPGVGLVPDVVTYSMIVEGHCLNLQVGDALNLTYEMIGKGITPREVTLNRVLTGLVRRGMREEALKLYDTVTEEGLVSDGQTFAMLAFPRSVASRDGETEELFERTLSKGIVPTTASCNIVLDRVINEGRIDAAKKIFSRITSECKPNVTTFKLMVRALCRNVELDEAYALIRRMRQYELEPNASIYNCMLSGFLYFENLPSARMLFQEMNERKLLNSISYSVMIRGLLKLKMIDDACEMFEAMLEKRLEPHIMTCERLLAVLCAEKMLDRAIILFRELMVTNGAEHIVCYNALMHGIAKSRDVDSAVQFLKEMVDAGVSPDSTTYASLIEAFCNENRVDEAYKLLVAMTKRGETPVPQTFRLVLQGFWKQRRFDEAYEFYCWIPQGGGYMTLSIHNVMVEMLYHWNKFDLLDRLMQRRDIPDVIHRRVEILKEQRLGELEVRRFERALEKKQMTHKRFLEWHIRFCKR